MRQWGAASSGATSGFGLAIAKTIASGAMLVSASAGSTRAPETPTSRSMPSSTSAGPPARPSGFVCSAYQRLIAGALPSR
jgi:hypothetical protein